MGQVGGHSAAGPHDEAPLDMWRAEAGMWQAGLVDAEEWCVCEGTVRAGRRCQGYSTLRQARDVGGACRV